MTTAQPGHFGALLRAHRLAVGLTQEELAERAGLSGRGIQDLERGVRRTPQPGTARRLANALGLTGEDRAALLTAGAQPARTTGGGAPDGGPAPHLHNVPAELSSFVGREGELIELAAHLSQTRLLTLVGPGGVGKTRLALRLASSVVETYPGGVWLVDLAPLADARLVPDTIAMTLGIREQPGSSPLRSIEHTIGARAMLLLLDNCEHLLAVCADVIAALLRACGGLRVLTTSREPLAVSGERVWRVQPLQVPSPTPTVVLDDLHRCEATRLFIERAQSASRDFALDMHTAPAVAEICRQLDGMPLALELAAARVGVLTVGDIAARLDERFRLLVDGRRDLPHRQQTLRATLDWSYDLLSESERIVLRQLSVFSGGGSLDAVEGVCGDANLCAVSVLNSLSQLVAKSLVLVDTAAAEGRYTLLETVRAYAAERLAEAGETTALRHCHATWYLAWAERAAPELTGAHQAAWYARLDAEYDNLRAALTWSSQQADMAHIELRLAAALGRFWRVRGLASEGRRWLAHALSREAVPDSAARALALSWFGRLATIQGEAAAARAPLEQSVAMATRLGVPDITCLALVNLAYVHLLEGDIAAARLAQEQALANARLADDPHAVAFAMAHLADTQERAGDHRAAQRLAHEALAWSQRCGGTGPAVVALDVLAQVALADGDLDGAWRLYGEEISASQTIQYTAARLHALLGQATVARQRGDLHTARLWCREAARTAHEVGETRLLAAALLRFAGLVLALGDARRAARLVGAVRAWEDAVGSPTLGSDFPVGYAVDLTSDEAAAQAALGAAAFRAAWQSGRRLSLDAAVSDVLAE